METQLEHILISSHKDEMIAYLAAHPEYFEEAVRLAISNKRPYSWRAAWLLWSCMEKNDPRVQEYINDIVKTLTTKNDDHQRELIKILQQMELKEEHKGSLFDVCVSLWKKIDNKPSVRFNAFKMLVKIALGHAELTREIVLLTENHFMVSLSSSAQKSINKMLGEIKPEDNTGGYLVSKK